MLENLPKKLKSKLGEIEEFYFKNSSYIDDIVLYGSSVRRTRPRDIDILVLLNGKNKREEDRDFSYELRKLIEEEDSEMEIDVKGKYLEDLFNSDFLAGGSIILEGYSLVSEEFLARKLNLDTYTLFRYDLENLDKNEKTKYTYSLKGRGEHSGILKDLEGLHLARGVILIPIQNTGEFKEFLERWGVKYEEYRIGMTTVL